MASGIFNISKGAWRPLVALPAANDALIILLLKSAGLVADDTLADYADVAAILAGASDEADFTNYARKTLTTGITVNQDNTANRFDVDIPDQTWTSAGGATNNTLGKLIVAYDPDTTGGTDSTLQPLAYFDFTATTDGNNLVAEINASGLMRAA